MSNQYRGNRSPDSQGYSNRQSDDFGTQDRARASSSMPGESDAEFDAPQDGAGRQHEMDAGHGSGSGRGYGRQASQGWDQDYGFGGRQTGGSGVRGGSSSQGYSPSDRGRPGDPRDEGGRDGRESYRSQNEFGGRGFGSDDRGRQEFRSQDRGSSTGGQSGYGQRGGMGYGGQTGMGYGEQTGMGYGEHGGRGNYSSQGDQSAYPRDAGRNPREDRDSQGGNRMYGGAQQRGNADTRFRSSFQQQEWGSQRESQGGFSRGREFGSGTDGRSDGRQHGMHAGRGPKGWRRSDERITEDLCEALTRDPHIDASDIEVRVEQGDVTLTGTIDSREAKRAAEELAERCSGVLDVTNQLRVKRDDRSHAQPVSRSKHESTSEKQEVAGALGSHGHNGGQTGRYETRTPGTAGNDAHGTPTGKD